MRAVALLAIVSLLAAWETLASMLFLLANGYWAVFPWPAKAWMWARYAIEASSNPIVSRWLMITAIVAAIPFLALALAVTFRAPIGRRVSQSLYGSTGWADEKDMARGGMCLRDKL